FDFIPFESEIPRKDGRVIGRRNKGNRWHGSNELDARAPRAKISVDISYEGSDAPPLRLVDLRVELYDGRSAAVYLVDRLVLGFVFHAVLRLEELHLIAFGARSRVPSEQQLPWMVRAALF